jgi:hypothetical protein
MPRDSLRKQLSSLGLYINNREKVGHLEPSGAPEIILTAKSAGERKRRKSFHRVLWWSGCKWYGILEHPNS